MSASIKASLGYHAEYNERRLFAFNVRSTQIYLTRPQIRSAREAYTCVHLYLKFKFLLVWDAYSVFKFKSTRLQYLEFRIFVYLAGLAVYLIV